MANKIDTKKLDQHIGELNTLYSSWSTYSNRPMGTGENCGRVTDKVDELLTTLRAMENGFVTLLRNTISYMEQRKESIEIKEEKATQEIEK